MTGILEFFAQRKKAVAGFLAPGVGLLVADYTQSGHLPTQSQWDAMAAACVLTAFGVHQVKNKAAK